MEFLNSQKEFLSPRTINSRRAVGDALESLISDNFESILGNYVGEYSASFARRAMADLAFTDSAGNYYVVDVKTHRLDTKFNMPNLVSVERLSRFYEEDINYFVILKVDYEIDNEKLEDKLATAYASYIKYNKKDIQRNIETQQSEKLRQALNRITDPNAKGKTEQNERQVIVTDDVSTLKGYKI